MLKITHYTKYNKLKGLNKDKQQKESDSSKTPRLKQISLADAVKCHKVWDINQMIPKRRYVIHTKIRETISACINC